MKVFIGPYKKWWGPYQISDLLQYVGVNEEKCGDIGEWLADTWLMNVCSWIDAKRKRNIKVRIDDYDVWSLDNTLALIILPALKRLKEAKQGTPILNDEDKKALPVSLRHLKTFEPYYYNIFPDKKAEWDYDTDILKQQWDWIMNEMIWAFENIDDSEWDCWTPCYNSAKYMAIATRVKHGFALFGQFYTALWD